MPSNPIKIKDILVQGCKGQFLSDPKSARVCNLLRCMTLPRESERESYKHSCYILTDDTFYYFNKSNNDLTKIDLIKEDFVRLNAGISWDSYWGRETLCASDKQLDKIKEITGHTPPICNPATMTQSELREAFGPGFSKVLYNDNIYQVNPAVDPAVVLMTDQPRNSHSIEQALELIESIANHAEENRSTECINRVITDEFSFYPSDKPFTLDEYKIIIEKTAEISDKLSPNIHLALATFPVIWANGEIRNCGLYVESPNSKSEKSTLHHFHKKRNFESDCYYLNDDKKYYDGTGSNIDDSNPEYSVQEVLKNTRVLTNDNSQYQSAFKTSGNEGENFIVSIGICYDHSQGVERDQVHQLIEQLKSAGQIVPMHCSHVITSASINQKSEHTLSTVSHADPNANYRRPVSTQLPGRSGFSLSTISSSFSGTLEAEHYPAKQIGILHSDLFQHLSSNQADIATQINQRDAEGNTMLHQVFQEAGYDRELIAKRLYFLIINGGDPEIKNASGQSTLDLANDIDAVRSDPLIKHAIHSALQYRAPYIDQNRISDEDNHTLITRAAHEGEGVDVLANFIEQGSNPYLKDGTGQSAMDIVNQYPESKREEAIKIISKAYANTQYGFIRPGIQLAQGQEKWFMHYIPKDLNEIDMPEIEKIVKDFTSIFAPSQANELGPTEILSLFTQVSDMKFDSSQTELIYDAIQAQLSKVDIHISKRITGQSAPDLKSILFQTMKTALFDKLKGRWATLIQNPNNLECLKELLPRQRTIVFNEVKANLNHLIKKPSDLQFLEYLLPEQRSFVFDNILTNNNQLMDKVQNSSDLNFMKYLSPQERNHVFEQVSQPDKLREMIKGSRDLKFLEYLLPKQRSLINNLVMGVMDKLDFYKFDITFIAHLSNEGSRKFLDAIPQKKWEDDISFKYSLKDLVESFKSNSQDFIFIVNKCGQSFFEAFHDSSQRQQFEALETLSHATPEFLKEIKSIVPDIINNLIIPGKKGYFEALNKILVNTYMPGDNEGYQALFEQLDKPHQDMIITAVGEDFSAKLSSDPPVFVSRQEQVDYKNVIIQARANQALQQEQQEEENIKPNSSSSLN